MKHSKRSDAAALGTNHTALTRRLEEFVENKERKPVGRPPILEPSSDDLVADMVKAYAQNKEWINMNELRDLVIIFF